MISIFTRSWYLGNRFHRFPLGETVQRLSARIRGDEVSEYMGPDQCLLNPTEWYEGDVCIFVKPAGLDRVKDGQWVDILDDMRMVEFLKERPKVKVIAASQNSYDYLKTQLTNEIVLIPHHHINWEGFRRTRKEITTVGYIGSPSPQALALYEGLRERLKVIGLGMVTCFDFKTRVDAIHFYDNIDIFAIADFSPDYNPNKIPTKIINAGSFFIPTVAFPLAGYKEIEGSYIRVFNPDQLVEEVGKLKDPVYYEEWAHKAYVMSEKYHLSRVTDLYRKLT